MSLDSWLALRNPELRRPAPPQADIGLSSTGSNDTGLASHRPDPKGAPPVSRALPAEPVPSLLAPLLTPKPSATAGSVCHPPPRFRRSTLTSAVDTPPEAYAGGPALHRWTPTSHYETGDALTCVQCLPDTPYAAIAATKQANLVHLVNCLPNDAQLDSKCIHASAELPLDWPVTAMTMLGPQTLLCGSNRGVARLDLRHPDLSTARFDLDFSDEISALQARDGPRQLVAVGTSSGSLKLWDVRERTWDQGWTRTHAVVDGPRVNRVNPPVAHVVWASDTVLATASKHNESVKFWDLRARGRAPLMTTQPSTAVPDRLVAAATPLSAARSSRKTLSGISGLCMGSHADLWAVNTRGELLSLSALQRSPEYRLKVHGLQPTRGAQAVVAVDHPQYPLLAVAGKGGTSLVTRPSAVAREMGLDAVQAVRLPMPAADVTAVHWHPYTKQLVTLTKYTWQIWNPTRRPDATYDRPLTKVRAHQLPIHY